MGITKKNSKKREKKSVIQIETVSVPMPDGPQRRSKAIEIALQAASRLRQEPGSD